MKPLNLFPDNRPDGSRHFRCKECQAAAYRTRYHGDSERRAFQIAYSMNGMVQRRFPAMPALPAEALATLILTNKFCRYCQLYNAQAGKGFQLDHIVPLSKGGQHALSNLAVCCDRCNRAKWNSSEDEYLAWLRGTAARVSEKPESNADPNVS